MFTLSYPYPSIALYPFVLLYTRLEATCLVRYLQIVPVHAMFGTTDRASRHVHDAKIIGLTSAVFKLNMCNLPPTRHRGYEVTLEVL